MAIKDIEGYPYSIPFMILKKLLRSDFQLGVYKCYFFIAIGGRRAWNLSDMVDNM